MLLDIVEPEDSVRKLSQELVIGIDLGTTNSLVASMVDGNVKIIPTQNDEEMLPSIVEFNGVKFRSIKRLMGKSYAEAEEILNSNPELKQYLVKGSEVIKFCLNKQEISPIEISSQILAKLKSSAEKFLDQKVNNAVITVPAYFDDASRNETKLAAELAGLNVLRLIAEPTAAAFAYGLENGKEGFFLVYDLGGGTFDVSLLNMQMGVFQVLATGGDLNIGGDDIDLLIAQNFSNEGSVEEILPFAKEAKEKLSFQNEYSCSYFKLTKDELRVIISPLINRTIKIMRNVIDDAEIDLDQIAGVIMVGGSTRIPLIKEIIKNQFNTKIFDEIDPDKIVAVGAALQAHNLSSGASNLLIDVTPLSLGIELVGGVVDVIIPRNSPLPAQKTVEFTTHEDNQTGMQFHIVQGERSLAKNCRSLARFELTGIPPMKAKMARIKLEFFIDVDGVLSVQATDQIRNITEKLLLRPSYGITQEDVISMLKNAFENAKNDHKTVLLIKIKNEAQDLMKAIKKFDRASEVDFYVADLEEKMQGENYEEIYESLTLLKSMAIDFFNQNLKEELSNSSQML